MKMLAYDCGNPVIICLRAFARSAFLFTGSPRSFHSLAMTKGTKWIITHSLTTPPQPPTRHVARGPGAVGIGCWLLVTLFLGFFYCFTRLGQVCYYHLAAFRILAIRRCCIALGRTYTVRINIRCWYFPVFYQCITDRFRSFF